MINLETLKSRVRLLLDDAGAVRFSEDLLESAARLALHGLDEKLPLALTTTLEVSTAGRDQSLSGIEGCLYLVSLGILTPSAETEEEIKIEYSYVLQSGTLSIHFSGIRVPQNGETLRIRYAAQNTLSGLDEATTTSLPDSAAVALEFGCAGYACLLRASALSEAYGARPGESARMVDQSRLWFEQFNLAMNSLRNSMEYGYPDGFVLDQWDRKGRPV
jgi:hypothetical protein